MVLIGGIIYTIILLLCIMYCIIQHLQNRETKKQYIHIINELTESSEQKIVNINTLYEKIEMLTDEKLYYKDRVDDLEKAIETGFGISVRKNVTIVNTDLLKFDYVIMLAGINKLIKDNPEKIDDIKYYIELMEKIQAILDKMPEIQEEKGASEIINAI